jgi:hypothetical protein
MPGSFGKIALSCCFFAALPLSAWWETGHQVVARLAAAHLTAAARGRVARLLDVADTPEAVADALANASIWADETRKETRTGSWHYIDLTLQDTPSDIPLRCKDRDCAPARIRLFAAQLRSRNAEYRWSNLDALRYLVHFVGDIHQPLHAISDADLGGNCERLDPPVGEAKNLHALWDGELVNELSRSETGLASELERQVQQLDNERRRALASGSIDDWTWESHELAITDVYRKLPIPTEPVEFPASCNDAPLAIADLRLRISAPYLDAMKPVVRDQLMKAGLRLAKLLNDTFGPE